MVIATDLARLHTQLPERENRMGRAERRSLKKLFSDVGKAEYEWPKTAQIDSGALTYLSKKLDASVLRVYNEAVEYIQSTEEHLENYKTLRDADPNCGGFSEATAILEEATPFEQMVALDQWIDRRGGKWKKGRRTICLQQGDDDYVPLYIASRKGVPATTMTVMLGVSGGDHKAPRYSDFAEDANLAQTSVFAKPLECLETVRQPYFSAATILKGGAFERGVIDHKRRYEITDINKKKRSSQFACVELVGQNQPKNASIKEESAGKNLVSLFKKHGSRQIHSDLNYEELAPEGYRDNVTIRVTPKKIWEAVKKSVCDGDSEQLDDLMRKLFLLKFAPFTSSAVNAFYAEKIFD